MVLSRVTALGARLARPERPTTVRDESIAPGEDVALRFPIPEVGAAAVAEHDGDPFSYVFVFEIDAVDVHSARTKLALRHVSIFLRSSNARVGDNSHGVAGRPSGHVRHPRPGYGPTVTDAAQPNGSPAVLLWVAIL
jgi:hypothetical protein